MAADHSSFTLPRQSQPQNNMADQPPHPAAQVNKAHQVRYRTTLFQPRLAKRPASQSHRLSIFGILMLVMTALILVPLTVASLYFYSGLSRNLRHEAETYLNSFITMINESLERRLNSIDNTSMVLLSNRELRDLLTDDTQPMSLRAGRMAELLKYQLFFNYSWDERLIRQIYVCRNALTFFESPEVFFQAEQSAEVVRQFYRKTDDLAVDKYLIPPTENDPSIVYFRNINDINTTKNIGRLYIRIDPARLNDYGSQLRYQKAIVMTINETGTIFSHTDPARVGQMADPSLYQLRDAQNLAELAMNGQIYLVWSRHLAAYGLYSIVAVPKAEAFAGLYRAVQLAIPLLVLTLAASLLLSGLLARYLTRHTRSVIASMELIRQGHFDERMPRQRFQEFDELAGVFNHMAGEVDHLIHEVYEKQLLLREAELKALQTQINPHFLFNVLETISWQARMNQDEAVQSMIGSLAQLLRAGLSWSCSETIPVAQELTYIRFYLDLQKIRFADRLTIHLTLADDSLNEWLIPRLALMPLVENAFIHGLEPKKGPGLLQISIWDEGDLLYCQVSDDGVGFDPRTIPLNAPGPDRQQPTGHTGIGILNTHYRIRLLYGPLYGIQLHSEPGVGTKVILVLPRSGPQAAPESRDTAGSAPVPASKPDRSPDWRP